MYFIDTHAHLDGHEFDDDRDDVIARAKAAGIGRVFIPAIDLPSVDTVLAACSRYPGYAYPMIGLHPEEVKADWSDVLDQMRRHIEQPGHPFIAIGEVGLDYYWSREFEHEQLEAFERQVQWSVEYRLPLMIHCRKGQNEMVNMMRRYKNELPGGVLPHIPMERIVLETDAPYMAPVPMRGKRNESAFVSHVLARAAECYGVEQGVLAEATNATVRRIFGPLG